MDEFAAMARLIEALRPWLRDLVIVGGWAHRLHRLHPLSNPPAYLPLRTRDADLAFSPTAPLGGNIGAALEAAGFEEEFLGDVTPPVAHYRLGGDDQGFYAEFLAPLRGQGVKRDGSPDATIAKAGVIAQKLRHLDLLLTSPWAVGLGGDVGVPLEAPVEVMLANPVSFIAQKLLIQRGRSREKRAQDVLYIHDTLELFGGAIESLRTVWLDQVRPTLPEKTARAVERVQHEQFEVVTDVIRSAVRIPQNRELSPERVRAVCAYGLEAILGAE